MTPDTTARQAAENRGQWAERLARWALRLTGWKIIAKQTRGLRGSGAGEIDIIATRGRTLAFIEVKARRTSADALSAISQEQQRRITRGAEAYLAAHPEYAAHDIRFDVMTVRPWRWPERHADAWRA